VRPTILLLGGTGRAGRVAARLLLEHTDARVVVGSRRREQAAVLAASLARDFPGGRVDAVAVDATDESSLRAALEGASLLFDCGPTALFTGRIPLACIATGVDCLDIHPSRSLAVLRPLAPEVARAGRCFVTQAGLHPGLPATVMRHAASLLTRCDSVAAAMLFNIGEVPGPESVVELIEEMGAYRSLVWRDGAWRKPSWSHTRRFDFGPGFGPRTCYPMWSDELEGLPERIGARDAGFYVAGFNWFADAVVTPLALGLGSIRRGLGAKPLARLLAFSVRRFGRPPFAIVLTAEATGERDGTPRNVRVVVRSDDDDGYRLTAIPAVACVKQLLEGGIARPGVHLMGHLVEPARLAGDMRRMGIGIEVSAGS
jgi:saccharopine dehydrogenase-like NADP-dependent oxidoreductase